MCDENVSEYAFVLLPADILFYNHHFNNNLWKKNMSLVPVKHYVVFEMLLDKPRLR